MSPTLASPRTSSSLNLTPNCFSMAVSRLICSRLSHSSMSSGPVVSRVRARECCRQNCPRKISLYQRFQKLCCSVMRVCLLARMYNSHRRHAPALRRRAFGGHRHSGIPSPFRASRLTAAKPSVAVKARHRRVLSPWAGRRRRMVRTPRSRHAAARRVEQGVAPDSRLNARQLITHSSMSTRAAASARPMMRRHEAVVAELVHQPPGQASRSPRRCMQRRHLGRGVAARGEVELVGLVDEAGRRARACPASEGAQLCSASQGCAGSRRNRRSSARAAAAQRRSRRYISRAPPVVGRDGPRPRNQPAPVQRDGTSSGRSQLGHRHGARQAPAAPAPAPPGCRPEIPGCRAGGSAPRAMAARFAGLGLPVGARSTAKSSASRTRGRPLAQPGAGPRPPRFSLHTFSSTPAPARLFQVLLQERGVGHAGGRLVAHARGPRGRRRPPRRPTACCPGPCATPFLFLPNSALDDVAPRCVHSVRDVRHVATHIRVGVTTPRARTSCATPTLAESQHRSCT